MIITALTKFTTIDFPGRLSCIVFTGGCNFRCGFCHNAEFVLPEQLAKLSQTIPFETVLNFLSKRRGLLDGVSICGGEPTLNPDLPEKMRQIKNLGFQVKIDTNGSNPEMLEQIINEGLVDYIAMDLKDALPYRMELIGINVCESSIRQSIDIIRCAGFDKGIEYEFRSTILPAFHTIDTLCKMGEVISGAKKWVLQKFRNGNTLMENFRDMQEFSDEELKNLVKYLSVYADKVEFRSG